MVRQGRRARLSDEWPSRGTRGLGLPLHSRRPGTLALARWACGRGLRAADKRGGEETARTPFQNTTSGTPTAPRALPAIPHTPTRPAQTRIDMARSRRSGEREMPDPWSPAEAPARWRPLPAVLELRIKTHPLPPQPPGPRLGPRHRGARPRRPGRPSAAPRLPHRPPPAPVRTCSRVGSRVLPTGQQPWLGGVVGGTAAVCGSTRGTRADRQPWWAGARPPAAPSSGGGMMSGLGGMVMQVRRVGGARPRPARAPAGSWHSPNGSCWQETTSGVHTVSAIPCT